MIGAAKAIISESVSATYSMFVDPSGILVQSPPGAATSPACEAYPSNGVEPYSYQWTKVSGDNISVSNSTAKSVTFSASSSSGSMLVATYECEVTDDLANKLTADVEIVFLFGNQF